MGNTESNVTSGVKKQADTSSILIYKLVDLKGGGLLVELMKRAARTKQYAELDHAIKTKVEPFLYNKGEGRLIPFSHLVLLRNKERPRHKWLPYLKHMDDTTDLDIDKMPIDNDPEKIDPKKCREVCWDLKERGAVGETILHLCLLNATSIHADLAKRLLRFYPKLINDIYMCDEYYGESVLHLAIVNEDPAMVKFLLDSGADYHERCTGNFMCPEDQKATRQDTVEHEWVNVAPLTNYEGYVYWGEYPLSFAACLGQEECYRLMLARGANPDNQDTNGNTVLHMLVIYEKLETFDMAYEVGANISVRNVQNLTPLTLAAKLARIEMFFHILNIEREIYWQIGSITCAAYPLSQIDTIDIETGQISKNSALNLVVFGDKDEHLELMDGVLVDLLNAKWNAFVKLRFYRQFFQFLLYFLVSLICFTLRPGPPPNLGQQAPAPGNPPVNITTFTKENNTIPQLVAALKAMVPDSQSYKRRKRQIPNSSDFAKEPVASRVNYIITYNNSENRVSEDVKGGKMDGKKGLSETNLTNVNSTSDSSSAKLIDNKLIFLRNVVASFQNDSLTQQNTSSHGKIDEMVDTNSNKYSSQSIFDSIQDKGIRGSRRDQNTTTLNTSSMDKFKTYLSRNSTNSNDSVSFSPTNKSDERELKNHNLDNCTAQAICFKQSAQANEDFLGVGKPANDRKTERQVEKTESKHDEDDDEEWWEDIQECRLLRIRNYEDVIRLSAEVALEIGALLYLLAAMREASFLGLHMFIENLMTVPSRVMFLFSCLLMMGAPLLRFSCEDEMEDIVAVIIMLTTSPYFLFFCRGFKTVGPFVVMIYRMVMGDLLRFVSIYVVFVMGFSQAYYIIFLSFDNPVTPDGVDDSISNPMPHPMEAAMAMFLMSLTTFGDYFSAFEKTEHEIEAKISVRTEYPTQLSETALKIIFQFFSWLREHSFSAFINITTKKRQSLWTSIGGQYKVCFVVYMGIVAILLVNMLIAMMGNTYQKIAETRNEWQRQWARIVLVVERGVSPSERLTKLMWYSQPMSDGRRALVLRLHQSEQDKEEMKEILEMKRVHNKIVEKRLKRLNRLSNNPSPSKPLVELPNLSNCGSPTKPLIDLTTNLNKL